MVGHKFLISNDWRFYESMMIIDEGDGVADLDANDDKKITESYTI